MKKTNMEKEINIQGLEILNMTSPWERYEDPDEKERDPWHYISFGDVSICMQEVDASIDMSWWKIVTKVILI